MIGLADSFMNASRFRADQEARARDAEMRQRQMAMQEASHRMQMEEGGLRLGQMRRQDQALQEYGQEGAPGTGLPAPAAAIGADPYAGQPAGQGQFMEANGVTPPAAGLPAPKSKYAKELKLARAQGDMKTALALQDREKADGVAEGRKAEMQRLLKMKPEELEAMWSTVNRDGSGVNMMLTFDPKSRKYMLVSKEEGVPSRLFSQAELATDMMAFWEAGNGDTLKGMEAMMANVKRRREAGDREYGRSVDIAKGNSKAYFDGLGADNDAARTAEVGRHNRATEGLDRARTNAAVGKQVPPDILQELSAIEQKHINAATPAEKQALERQYQMVLSRAGVAMGKPMGLPSQRQASTMTEKDINEAALELMKLDSKLSFQGAKLQVTGNYDPMAAFKEALQGGAAPKKAAPAPTPAPPAPPAAGGLRPTMDRFQGPLNPQAAQIMDVLERQRMARELSATLGR